VLRTALEPIALAPGEGEALWFLGTLVTVKSTSESTGPRCAAHVHRQL
jgi:hypothetical protein